MLRRMERVVWTCLVNVHQAVMHTRTRFVVRLDGFLFLAARRARLGAFLFLAAWRARFDAFFVMVRLAEVVALPRFVVLFCAVVFFAFPAVEVVLRFVVRVVARDGARFVRPFALMRFVAMSSAPGRDGNVLDVLLRRSLHPTSSMPMLCLVPGSLAARGNGLPPDDGHLIPGEGKTPQANDHRHDGCCRGNVDPSVTATRASRRLHRARRRDPDRRVFVGPSSRAWE